MKASVSTHISFDFRVKGVHTFGDVIDSVMVLFLPLYHIYAYMHTLTSLYTGSCDVIMPKYDLNTYVQIVKKYQVSTWYICTGTYR